MNMNVETIRNKYAIALSILVTLFCLFIFYYLQQKKPIVQNNKHIGSWYSNVLKYGNTNIDSELYFTKLIQKNLHNAPIEDNGVGFTVVDSNSKDGIGLENVKSRILYLKGKVEWDTAPGKGTLVIINIPHHE